ncbi:hypothetical protein D3C77_568000 [compost metagenome]
MAAGTQVFGVRLGQHKVANRLAQGTVPVLIEAMAQLFGYRADAQEIDIGEIEVGFGVEVLIAQVATANNGHAVVYQPQLVVHTSMLQIEVEQSAQGTGHAGAASKV